MSNECSHKRIIIWFLLYKIHYRQIYRRKIYQWFLWGCGGGERWTTSVHGVCVCACVCAHSVVSASFRPHGPAPTMLLCPRGSPGKNTGVDFHALFQAIFRPRDRTRVSYVSCTVRRVLYHQFVVLLFFFFNWSRADLQCCVSFRCTAKWFSYTYINICSFSDSFPM